MRHQASGVMREALTSSVVERSLKSKVGIQKEQAFK